jgi:metalloendopeptidase OMA1, mitochondrial
MNNQFLRMALALALASCASLVLTGCATVPVTGRSQLRMVSADQEMQLGLTSFDKMKQDVPISQDPAANATVQRVGKRIAAAAGPDLPNAQWEFVVFDSKEANAFCLPGGKIGVYTGILPIAQTDAGLATVLGHEVAHAAAHHGAERMSYQMALQYGEEALGKGLSTFDPKVQSLATAAYGMGTQVGIELPFSRKDESEADHMGLVYMARAGYNPEEALAFWQRFAAAVGNQGGTPVFLRTHPLTETRIQELKQEMPQATAEYNSQKNRVSH